MDDPAEWPQYIFYFDGFQVQVDTPEARSQMWPDYGKRPDGPFPGIDMSTVPWEPWHGPFAPNGGGLHGRVYATAWVLIDRHVYAEGEILPPPTTFEQERLLRSGALALVPAGAQPVTHAPTGRVFLDRATHDAYDRRYKARDLTGFEWAVLASPDAAFPSTPTGEPDSEPLFEGRSRGRTPGSGKLYPDPHAFVEILGKGVDRFYMAKGRWPTREEAIYDSEWPDHKPSVDILKARFSTLGTTYSAWINARPKRLMYILCFRRSGWQRQSPDVPRAD